MRYVLWGVGSEKSDIRDYALDKYGKDVMYFVDNSPLKQGVWEGINVFSPEVLKTEKEEFELIILCMDETKIKAIQKQIENMNISPKINLLEDFRRDYLLRSYLRNMEKSEKENLKLRQALVETRLELYKLAGTLIPIEEYAEVSGNDIEDYWTKHTVLDDYFLTAKDSIEYCDTRFSLYPYFKEYAEMENAHDDEIILDYGCGPGNDLVWYSYNNNSLKKIIGIDVSRTALRHARYRLAVMGVDSNKARLIHISEQESKIPLEDGSVDFINCQGVLHHTSSPQDILKEFYRVLNKDKDRKRMAASIMVYNKESIWWHLYVAYYLRYVDNGLFSELPDDIKYNMSLEEIFRRSTDGVNCAKSECYNPDEFIEMCKNAGFSKIIYKGGYPDIGESNIASKYIDAALHDDRLEEEHKQFLKQVEFDKDGYPLYKGKHCCISGVYILY